ncbi:hypothetical protein [Massilia sp. BJB1822]|uniref:hypothetical protein n=1 Tax=Massilia sp. BJB1822 TaxID=2744470 RepID=UPI001593C93D|nr:hypothetical protein [Massilia sp. BJB1822]NVE00053.1 hypothetical protein [Massilia sp. BJB1822]
MDSKEEGIMKMYRESEPDETRLFERSSVNHAAWTLLALTLALCGWLMVALVNAENQRYALASGMCQDQVFKGGIDKVCLAKVRSRDHWWQHLGHAMTTFKP